MDVAVSILSNRWPCFTRIYHQTWELKNTVMIISNDHKFRYVNCGFCYWFGYGNSAVINRGIGRLPLGWLDKYEQELVSRLCSRPIPRGGAYPFAASVAGLRRSGSIYETSLDKYNSKKKSRKIALEKINAACADIFEIASAVWSILPAPLAEEITPALFTMPLYDRESPPR